MPRKRSRPGLGQSTFGYAYGRWPEGLQYDSVYSQDSSGAEYGEAILNGEGISPGIVERFMEAARRFRDAREQLLSLDVPPAAPEYVEFSRLLTWADSISGTMQAIESGLASAWTAGKRFFGLSGARKGALQGLSALPILGFAAVTGAIALLVAATNQMMTFVVNWRRVEAGESPVPGSGGTMGETFAGASTLVKWVVFGAIVYFAAPAILKRLDK